MQKRKNQRSSRSEYALVDERISIKREEISSYLVYNIVSLGKQNLVHDDNELAARCLENLAIKKIYGYFE